MGSAVYSVIPGKYTLEWPTTILGFIAIFVTIPIYIFYWKAPTIRAKSKFAQVLAADGKAAAGTGRRNTSVVGHPSQRGMSIRRMSMPNGELPKAQPTLKEAA